MNFIMRIPFFWEVVICVVGGFTFYVLVLR